MTKITKPMIRIHDLTTNEIVDREMNNEELLEYEANKEAALIRKTEAEAKAVQRQVILDRLGLTSEEAALLLS